MKKEVKSYCNQPKQTLYHFTCLYNRQGKNSVSEQYTGVDKLTLASSTDFTHVNISSLVLA